MIIMTTTTTYQQNTNAANNTKHSKWKTRTTARGRTPVERFSLIENATVSLNRYLTEDISHLGDFLLSFSCNSVEKMVMLLNTRMSVASPDGAFSDYTPLGFAIIRNNPKAVNLLLRFGACVQSAPCTSTDTSVSALSPLHLALSYLCQPAVVDALLVHGASTASIERRDVSSLFSFIVQCPSKTTASALMSVMPCLGATDRDKRTLLHVAAKHCNATVASSVLNGRLVNVDQVDAMAKTALMYAAEENSPLIIQLLLDAGAAVNFTDAWGRTALHFAARKAGVKTVRTLLSAGADICAEDRKGLTTLTYACSHDRILHFKSPKADEDDLVKCLIESARTRVSLCERDFLHAAFLMATSFDGETAIMKLLTGNREHVSKRNDVGQTLLHVAAEFNNHAAVKWLVEEGGLEPTVPDSDGWQPLHYAAKGGNNATFFYLLHRYEADVDTATPSGWTPIWILTRNGWTDLACDVVRSGCDVRHTLTVLQLRQANSHFCLPLSLFDPKAQRADPVAYAKGGSRSVSLAEFSTECDFAELSRLLADRDDECSKAVQNDGA